MKKLLLIFLLLPLHSNAQLQDDFLDGDFNNNPVWYGDSLQFQISTYSASGWSLKPRLQLDGSIADTSTLSTSCVLTNLNDKEWDFWVRLAFNTSKSNNCRIYLVSDSPNLKNSLNGYFLMLGDDLNDQSDSISLWRQNGNTIIKIIEGHYSFTGASGNYRIKVERDDVGNWRLFSDPLGGHNFVLEGLGFDNTIITSSFFGIYCKYTSTNKSNFYFDDIYAGSQIVDTIPPQVLSINAISSLELNVSYSENVELSSSENILNYIITSLGNPISAIKNTFNPALITLTFANPISEEVSYFLNISGIKDLAGNLINTISLPFTYYKTKQYDIIINEIMADPSPSVGLPAIEYIELYNKTNFPISLSGWNLVLSNNIKTFPDIYIEPKGFLIVCATGGSSLLNKYGTVIEIPGFSLTNTGEIVELLDAMQHLISFVNFDDEWYLNETKESGGWSLERIDPFNSCGESDNWKASIDGSGGTPGKTNSIHGNNPDKISPVLIRASVNRYEVDHIKIYFNESLDSTKMLDQYKYNIDNGIGNPYQIKLSYPDNKMIILYFTNIIRQNILYTITVSDSIFDCSGNKIMENSITKFAIPDLPDTADLVINEVLSNPNEDCVDFIEIYNRSNKILDFKDLNLSETDENYRISFDNYLIFPSDYTVLSNDPEKVKKQYNTTNPFGFICMESFPSYSNDEGNVILRTNSDEIIDAMKYDLGSQFSLLSSTDGVSLERIDYNRPASDKTNWHSAAESVGYSTPSYKNSQFKQGTSDNTELTISPEIFSPDNDGYNDVLIIICKTDRPGKLLTITIFDSKGRLIKLITKNQYISTENTSSWDGTKDNNQKANIGLYVVYIEIIDLNGTVSHYKKTATLAAKL